MTHILSNDTQRVHFLRIAFNFQHINSCNSDMFNCLLIHILRLVEYLDVYVSHEIIRLRIVINPFKLYILTTRR
jgi:hypothetical protein